MKIDVTATVSLSREQIDEIIKAAIERETGLKVQTLRYELRDVSDEIEIRPRYELDGAVSQCIKAAQYAPNYSSLGAQIRDVENRTSQWEGR